MSRKGPGLLLRDILKGEDAQVDAVAAVIAEIAPDILVLQGIDYDLDLAALTALCDRIEDEGVIFPYTFARPPNAGLPSGVDMDGDGRLGEPEDAHSYGWFTGEGGQAILSRFAIDEGKAQDFGGMLWSEMPSPLWPEDPLPGQDVQRLSKSGHWILPVEVGETRLTLMSFHATTPVFDGPEDRNGRRNHDEILFWQHVLDGKIGIAPEGPFVIAGNANLDPSDGEGRRAVIRGLLNDPRVQDPEPRGSGAANTPGHVGDPKLDTVSWSGVGNLRVSYVLPSADLTVTGSGVHWPLDDETVATASRHRLVWVDVVIE
ncbi:MAG: endonuclease/exonuclease/phosphatase family protein [Pseudomonadota bacterium]